MWPVCETEDWLSKHLTPIRHHLDSVPPYNYTGIDEKISGIFDESTSSFLPESVDVSKTDTTVSEVDGATIPIAAKSKTLPEYACKYAMIKHKRSLSESKTTDGISLASNTNHIVSRTRFNSGTSDSNTSGVSSYESVFGVVMSDLCNKTLSPIPSSSNLLEVKKPAERLRRISLTGANFRETTISPQDAQGYAKLRSIRRYQRPQLSESAADELAEIIDSSQIRSNRLSVPHRRIKVRSLDRHSCFDIGDSDSSHDMSRVSDIGSLCLNNTTYTRGPCYTGICLPKNIMDLFPSARSNGTYVTRCIKDNDSMEMVLKHGILTDFISECDEYSVSSLSDISSTTSKRSKITGPKHNRHACLLCCRTSQNGINRFNSTNGVPGIGGGSNTSDIDLSGSSLALTATPIKKFTENGNLDTTYNSSESHLSDENYNDKIQETILRHVQRMANPVWSKQSKMALYKIKQKHPQFFRNICLYSDVCMSLSQNTYRFSSRKFLQEIFADVDYSSFYSDAFDIVTKKKNSITIDTKSDENNPDTTDTVDGIIGKAEHSPTASPPSPTANCLAEKVRNTPQISTGSMLSHPIKTHLLRSPPLASVYETSRENLSDSLGTHSKSILNSTPIGNDCEHQFQTEAEIEIIHENNRDTATAESTATDEHFGNDLHAVNNQINNLQNDNRSSLTYSRPRFNTLELDLSCTKNKFPITDRRKAFDLSNSISNSALYSQRITKSLSASITSAPSMSLYCEKRLQTSKSEAILTNNTNFMRNSHHYSSNSKNNKQTTTEAHSKNNHLAK